MKEVFAFLAVLFNCQMLGRGRGGCSCSGLFLDTGLGTLWDLVINLRREIKSRHIFFFFCKWENLPSSLSGLCGRSPSAPRSNVAACSLVCERVTSASVKLTSAYFKTNTKSRTAVSHVNRMRFVKAPAREWLFRPLWGQIKCYFCFTERKRKKKHSLFVSLTLRQRCGHMITGLESDPFFEFSGRAAICARTINAVWKIPWLQVWYKWVWQRLIFTGAMEKGKKKKVRVGCEDRQTDNRW